jgi:hypothetical protein
MNNSDLEKAFKFYKNGSYYRIHNVLHGKTKLENNENAAKSAQIMKKWFESKNVRRGNLTGFIYRGLPSIPQGSIINAKSFTSFSN